MRPPNRNRIQILDERLEDMPHVDLNYIDKTWDRMLITESDQFRMIDRLSSIDANIDQSDNKSFKARQITFGEDLCGNFESNRIFI